MKKFNKYFENPSLHIFRCIFGVFTFYLLLFTFHGYSQDAAGLKEVKTIENNKAEKASKSTNSVWDVLFNWNVQSQYNLEAGVETDGTYIYTASYNTAMFYKYTMTGTIVDSFSITGVSAIRDLAYDGTYFYGGSNGAAIYEMDFTSHTLVSTITCPSGATVRHIAYDPANDAFWVGGWNTGNRDFKLIDRSGQLINSIPAATHGLTSVYGTAYDGWTPGGPYLWAFDQGQSGEEVKIYQVNINTGQQTGVSHDCALDVASGIASPLAGGLFSFHNTSTGTTMLGGCIQMVRVFGYDLATCITPAVDVGVIAITNPVSSCDLSGSEPITVKVKNFGSAPVTGCQISYELAIFQTDTETISQTIQPGDTVDFTFTIQGDFTNLGGYLLTVYTMLQGDESNVNDTIRAAIYHSSSSNVPYTMGFEANEDLTGWTIIDANNDQFTWYYDNAHSHNGSYGCTYYYNSDAITPANDWIISKCVNLDHDVNYQISFWYKTASSNYHEKLALYYGTQPNMTAMSTMLVDLNNINNASYLQSTTSFTVPASGNYYFGWHVYSNPNQWYIDIDDVSISAMAGLENISGETHVNVYLLQGNSSLHIESESLVSSVKIWNTAGQIVYSGNEAFVAKDINVSEYLVGIYMVQVETTKGIVSEKIVINK